MRKNSYNWILFFGSFLMLFLIAPSTQSITGSANNEIAPPRLSCHKRCHVELGERFKDIYTSAECTICHGTIKDHQQISSLIRKTQLSQAIPPPELKVTDKIHVVKNQKKALMRLKGRKMVSPPKGVSGPPGMVYIPAGEFIMGSNERWEDESPEYVVYVPAFFIDKYEVTVAGYKKFLDATGYPAPSDFEKLNIEEWGDYPMINVNWFDAVAYAKWAGKRLPTEEEWEKAARGTDGRTYPWGMVFDPKKSNNPQLDSTHAKKVGMYEAGKSPYGLYDMSGNVWEWVDAPSWFNCLYYNCGISAPTYNRSFFLPTTKNNSLGFRCVKDGPSTQETAISLNIKLDN
jgi:formylglycine-generating enzyme required for sulfatase activity